MFKNLMIFAAGLGTRMAPITNIIPKPLVKIHGKPILYHNLELALEYNFDKIIINTHYLAQQVKDAIDNFISIHPGLKDKIIISHEEVLLDTGGGIKKAQKYFNEEIIFTLNSDSLVAGPTNPFQLLAENWKKDMNSLMLLHPREKSIGYKGMGDFVMKDDGSLASIEGYRPFVYTGVQLIRLKNVLAYPLEIFSLSKLFNNKNVYGLVNAGNWYHLTSPEDIKAIEDKLHV